MSAPDPGDRKKPLYLKVIACEVAFREVCHIAAQTQNVLDLDFLTQGHHDTPASGRLEIQEKIDGTPAGKYDALVLGYGLCSNILNGLTAKDTPLVVPRAHDCITFFLGSKERYQERFEGNPGTYYYTSGWLECIRRRNLEGSSKNMFLPAHSQAGIRSAYEEWVAKFGEEEAKYLLEVMGDWTSTYTHGTLIDFDFTKPLALRERVKQICSDRGWQYTEVEGRLDLFRHLLNGDWAEDEFLVVKPGERIVPSFDVRIIKAERTQKAELSHEKAQ